jgi:chromosome segregation ATPase
VSAVEEHQNRLVAQLVEITVKKTKLLEKILELTGRQEEALDEGSIEKLYSLIEDKQKHIEVIKGLDKNFELIYTSFEQKPLSIRAALQTHVERVQRLVKEIQQLEAQNHIKADKTMDEVKQRLKDLNKGKRGYNAYKRASLGQDANFLNKSK